MKHRHFTLIEILLVIGVIVMITGVTGLNIRRLYQEQKFNAEVSTVLDTLKIAQDLMMILQTDVTVNFTQNDKDKSIDYAIHFDKPPSKEWVSILTKKRPPLKAIKTLTFESQYPAAQDKEGGINIEFLSRGSVMSMGLMQLSPYANDTEKGPLNRFICLKGFPSPITLQTLPETGTICKFEVESEYLNRLTDLTKHEMELHALITP